jgi:hypothetical protein
MKKLLSRGAARIQVLLFALFLAPMAFAQTAPPDPFTTAMADATTRVGTYAAALVGLAAVGVVFMIAIKYVKKIPGAT